ncbi:MAG: family 16 glycosylhydrolase [Candidatus Hinthialibacter antarcticus]|nr:family 16 glycosylhydrolase [Candidatus Hinthialibacter antarcticus]
MKTHLFRFLLFVFSCLILQIGAAAPPETSQWVAIEELTDEFDGSVINADKWHDYNPQWKGRQPGLFSKKNVAVSNGELLLTARAEALPDLPEGYHTFTTAAVKSKAIVKYGYFEIRCKPMDSRASSAFWFYESTPEIWTEIDVFEIGGKAPKHENSYHMNAHVFHTPTIKEHISHAGIWKSPYRLADEYHIYALEWDEESLKWYVDGKIVRTFKNDHWHQPLRMNFDSETMPEWFGLPDAENLPSTFHIDYVRSWRKVDATDEKP